MKQQITPLLLSVFLLLSACTKEKKDLESTAEEARKNPQGMAAQKVKTAEAAQKVFFLFVRASGTVRSARQTSLNFRRSGLIKEISVENGERVSKGQSIASLDAADLILEKRRAETELAKAKDEYRFQFVNYGGNWGNDQSIADTLRESLKVRSGLRSAEVALEAAELRLEQSRIIAPHGGRIADMTSEPGQQADLSAPFCVLLSESAPEIEVQVLQSEAVRLKKGMKAEVRPIALPGEKFGAEVKNINPKVSSSGMVRVVLSFTKADERLFPGMDAEIFMEIPTEKRVVIPKEALLRRSGREVVFVFEEGRSRWADVEVAADNGREVSLLKGIKDGEKVIISNNIQLAHDAKVEEIEEDEQ